MAYLAGILALLLALGGGYWWTDSTAFSRGYKDRDGKCVAEKLATENEHLEAERQALAQRDVARLKADAAAQQVSDLRKTLEINSERFNRELNKRASATRVCFSPPVAKLLERPPAPLDLGGDTSSPATSGAPTNPTAPAPSAEGFGSDEAGTSERAAASYIDLIRDRFEACRAQLRAVIIGTGNDPIE